ncbi:TetR/AcrR family transcriptional regulator [Sphingomonas morindae]|uniref:TetR/AcrR family transcriptional regulator n=1 Tax=Sphingomonas morindae TaxID=1541170 RepID=A0ABY4X973_9SPHN|nr:TetR/AcrR family transcriptional regulator [Sphingomonas morindae]USI73428.1 TetR/AcrR family transcriptional regulator [Sphingomonas morindae]
MQNDPQDGAAPPRRARGRPRAFDRAAALTAAMQLFWRKGYEASSIADLTEAMGVGPTSLYAAFGSKDALYAEAMKAYAGRYAHLTQGGFRAAPTACEAVRAYLRDSATAMTGADCDLPRGCMVNLGMVGSEGHEALAAEMRDARGAAFDMLRARLAEAVASGELPPRLDVAAVARFIQTVQSGMAIRARDGATRGELEAVAALALAGWDAMIAAATPA